MADKAEKTKVDLGQIPWWGKILAGVLGGVVLVKYTPILECLTLFFYVLCVPVMLFTAFGLVSSGTLEGMTRGWSSTAQEINRRVNAKINAAKAA